MIDRDKYALVIDDDGYFCEDKIADLLAEVKRLKAKLFEAELWVNNDSYTFENDIRGITSSEERKCFTCGWIGDYGEFMLINEGYECLECSDKNRTDYEKRKWGGEEE